MKIKETTKNIVAVFNEAAESRWAWLLLIPVTVVYLLLFSISTSPLFAFEGGDSAIFKEIGLACMHGKVLYQDIFDNKGPLLYWINGLGMSCCGRMGIFVLQILFQTVALLFIYKIARFFVCGIKSVFVLLLVLAFYSVFMLEGNQCEEWMLPLICVAFYIGTKYFANPDCSIKNWETGLLGACFAMAFFIRPNDAVGMIGGCMAGLSIHTAVKRQWCDLLHMIALEVVGMVLVTAPIVTYFAVNNAMSDLIYGMFGVNLGYTGGVAGLLRGYASDSGSWILTAIFICTCIALSATKMRSALWIVIPCSVFECLLFGRSFYFHYYIVILPIYTVLFASVFAMQNKRLGVVALLVAFFMPLTYSYRLVPKKAAALAVHQIQILCGNYHYAYGDFLNISEEEIRKNMTAMHQLGSAIPNEERDSVWNYNLIEYRTCKNYFNYAFFAHNRIVQMNRMTFPLKENMDIDPLMLSTSPLWIVADPTRETVTDSTFSARYDIVGSVSAFDGCVGLFKRKE